MVAVMDALAREKGVRVVVPDRWVGHSTIPYHTGRRGMVLLTDGRPGMGGSTPVPLAIRMAAWLETVPLLLQHLRVDHVHLVAHSAGTTYLLNTLLAQRSSLLGQRETYVAMMAPWVHSEHSCMTLTNWAAKLPNGMLDSWNGLVRTINQRIAPSLSWSGGAISTVAGMFGSGSKEDANENALARLYGTSPEVAREMERLQGKFYFAEDTTAGNEDARLCLKMGGTELWGACEDYPDFVRTLVKGELERKNADAGSPGLKIRVFYAESDMLIGKGGQKYFEECWAQDGVTGDIDYEGTELPGTDHDSVSIGDKCALPTIFTDIANLSRP